MTSFKECMNKRGSSNNPLMINTPIRHNTDNQEDHNLSILKAMKKTMNMIKISSSMIQQDSNIK